MIVNGIDIKDITFVFQGDIKPFQTELCLKSIRQFLPEAEIILSTWEGSDVSNLDYNILVLNKDPGSFKVTKDIDNNIDRQIVSTINGLKKVKTKYAFKIRTDFKITNTNFLNYFDKFDKFDNKYKIVKKRILACTNSTRNPDNKNSDWRFPFHISDFAFFGLTEDLIELFNIPITSEEDKNYFKTHKIQGCRYKSICRFVPEQHIFINFLKMHNININCEHFNDYSQENIDLTELYLVNNFILLTMEQFNLLPFKEHFLTYMNIFYLETCYTHYDFLKMYKKYCHCDYMIPKYDEEKAMLSIFLFYKQIKRKVLKPFINILCIFIFNKEKKRKIRGIYK